MKFEKLNENLFDKQTVLTKEEMINSKGGDWSTGCGQAYFAATDTYEDVCEWYSETRGMYLRKV